MWKKAQLLSVVKKMREKAYEEFVAMLTNEADNELKKAFAKAKTALTRATIADDEESVQNQTLVLKAIQNEIDSRKVGNASGLPAFRVYPTFECTACGRKVRCGKSSIEVRDDGTFVCFAGCNCTGSFIQLSYVAGSGFTSKSQ